MYSFDIVIIPGFISKIQLMKINFQEVDGNYLTLGTNIKELSADVNEEDAKLGAHLADNFL